MHAILTENLSRRYGGVTVLHPLDLTVRTGTTLGLLGPNGAGKSTLMRLLLGLNRPSTGRVLLFGHDVSQERMRALRGVGSAILDAAPYPHLTGRQVLTVTRRMLGLPASETDRVLSLVGLLSAGDRRVANYSLGMQRRLGLARALLGEPRLLLLDEPTNGLDPGGSEAVLAAIGRLTAEGRASVVLASHLLREVEATADEVAFLVGGRVVRRGAVAALTATAPTVRIRVDAPERATLVARSLGADPVMASKGDALHVALAPGRADDRTATLIRRLCEAGVAIHEASPVRRNLADVYADVQAAA